MNLLEELQARGYMPQENGWWFDLCPLHGGATIRVMPDDTDIVIYMFDRHMANLWTVRLSSPPWEVLVGALNIAEGCLGLQERAAAPEDHPDDDGFTPED